MNRRPEQICRLHVTQSWGGGGHYSSRTQINAGAKTGPLFESPPRPLLKSSLQSLGRYGTHQETISMRDEQMYTLCDTKLEWSGKGPLFEFNLNKCLGQNMGTIRAPLSHYLCQTCGPCPGKAPV